MAGGTQHKKEDILMLHRSCFFTGLLLLMAACQPQGATDGDAALRAHPGQIEAYMAYLASDDLEGREAGTPGYDAAAAYVASELEALGVAPGGVDGTYRQTVPLQRGYRDPDGLSLRATGRGGQALGLVENEDFVIYGSSRLAQSVATGEAVFVGYGLVAPDLGQDDYAGLDVEGKVVLMLSGMPSGLETEQRAYYSGQRSREAAARGAVAILSVPTAESERRYSFQRLVSEGRLNAASLSWIKPDGEAYTATPGLRVGGRLSPEGAAKLFSEAGLDLEAEIAARAEAGVQRPGHVLPLTLSLAQQSELDRVQSDNVIGLIEGSDPVLKHDYILMTAHLDHIGVSESFEADRINNGALDNAAGVATLLEAARMILDGPRPRRSILLVFVTAEEKGLLGSQYFAQNPTVPAESLVGLVNLDMPVLTYDFTDLVAFGAERSTIGEVVRDVAADMSLTLSPDPFPTQGLFTRSDHYRFVQIGVPSVFLATGFANGGEDAWAAHFAETYHRPGDDMDNDLNFGAAARFAEVNARIARALADGDERPLWRRDDFFARQFDGPQVRE